MLLGGKFMFKEFKEFALKGNVVDLAIGVIIGGAFQKIVTSLVNDIIMPAISIFTGKIDYSDLVFTVGDVSIAYGSFITAVLDFLIVAIALFLIIKYINKLNKKLEEAKLNELTKFGGLNEKITNNKFFKKKHKKEEKLPEPTTKICPYCVSEISIKATRCPHCTSVLVEDSEVKNVEDSTTSSENE
jgi:large conductance mechanosensitive channel